MALAYLASGSVVLAEDAKEGPRTGYFYSETTPLELLGPEGARALAEVFAEDEELKWSLYVPESYSADNPPGVMVFISPSSRWGGSSKSYNPLLEEKNLIWAGLIKAGDKTPMNTRMMRALLTPTFLAQDYALDPSRIYLGGFTGGAHVATMLATSKPNLFRGAMFVGGAITWKDKLPPGIEQIRQNRYVYVAGSNDVALTVVKRSAAAFKEAGIENTRVIVMPNERQEMPGPYHLREAIEYLDNTSGSTEDE
jgi:predicted peptidase